MDFIHIYRLMCCNTYIKKSLIFFFLHYKRGSMKNGIQDIDSKTRGLRNEMHEAMAFGQCSMTPIYPQYCLYNLYARHDNHSSVIIMDRSLIMILMPLYQVQLKCVLNGFLVFWLDFKLTPKCTGLKCTISLHCPQHY